MSINEEAQDLAVDDGVEELREMQEELNEALDASMGDGDAIADADADPFAAEEPDANPFAEPEPEPEPAPVKKTAKKKAVKKKLKDPRKKPEAPAPKPAPSNLALPSQNALTTDIKKYGLGKWAIAQVAPEKAAQSWRENFGEDGPQFDDLDVLKVPSGGSTIWEVPSIEGPKPVTAVQAVVLFWNLERRFWHPDQEKNTPPSCYSDDAKVGCGTPGGACAECEWAEFGSKIRQDGSVGRGQACQLKMTTFLLRPSELLPMRFSIPVNSFKPMRRFFKSLASRAVSYYEAIVQLKLEKTVSKDGDEFSRLVPTFLGLLSDEYVKKVAELRAGIEAMFKNTRTPDSEFTYEEAETEAIEL